MINDLPKEELKLFRQLREAKTPEKIKEISEKLDKLLAPQREKYKNGPPDGIIY